MPSVRLASGTELMFASEVEVEMNLPGRGFRQDTALLDLERSDLTTHVYEGGFKVWECSIDVCNFIEKNAKDFEGKKVLELGCGAALPAIVALKNGADMAILQDFNECVLECFTKDNVLQNEVSEESCRFISCDWKDFPTKVERSCVDVILTAETIYNEADYESLHDAMNWALNQDGIVVLGAKLFYFGVGGSVPAFLDFVKSKGTFLAEEKEIIDTDVPRRIIVLRRV